MTPPSPPPSLWKILATPPVRPRTARNRRWWALLQYLKICHIYTAVASISIYRNNRTDSTNKRRSCSQHVCLTWIYRWNQWRIFSYKYKLSLALLYSNDMFMNKLITKWNGVLNKMVSRTEEFTMYLEEMSPQKQHKWLQILNLSPRKRDGREVICAQKL